MWAAVVASLVFWGFTVAGPRTPLPDGARLPPPEALASGTWSQVLGEAPAPEEEDDEPALADDSRFQLMGVVAPRGAPHSAQGVALIAIDQEPPRVVRTGAVVDGDVVLLAVNTRSAELGPRGGPASIELTLPEPDAAPATSVPHGAPMATPAAPGMQRPRPFVPGAGMGGQGQVAPAIQPQPMMDDPNEDTGEEEEE